MLSPTHLSQSNSSIGRWELWHADSLNLELGLADGDERLIGIFSKLANLLDRIQRFHDLGIIRCEDEKWIIENPVNPGKNFADRWNDPESKKADACLRWVNWGREDLTNPCLPTIAVTETRMLRQTNQASFALIAVETESW